MAKNVELLLLRTVENLGIVGDIVKVKPGYARNYLLPMGFAEKPTPSKIDALKDERVRAQAEMAALRGERETLLNLIEGLTLTLIRSCNAKGGLYGSVTQRDIVDGLSEAGFQIDHRAVRLAHAMRRIGDYQVPIQFDKDLRAEINVIIEPDQPLEEREEMEFDDEGELIEKPIKPKRSKKAEQDAEEPKAEEPAVEAAETSA